MLNATIIKHFFKNKFQIPVRVRKVAVKRPFFQVWIPSQGSPLGELKYNHQFPPDLGNHLLRIVYGDDTTIVFPAGNIRTHSLSFDEEQWNKLMTHYA